MTISKLPKSNKVRSARRVLLEYHDELNEIKDLERLIRAKLKDTIINIGNSIIVEFLNKKFVFTLKSIDTDSDEDIAEQLSNMKLAEDSFYIVDANTSLKIASKNINEPEFKSKVSLNQVGGLDDIIQDLKRTMNLALGYAESSSFMKISRAVLIYGLPGSGKSMICEALAENYSNARIIRIDSGKIFSKFYGESEANLKKYFDEAAKYFPTPAIIIIEDIASICPKNDNSDAVRRVSSLLASLIDSLHLKRDTSKIFVLANTSSLDNVDPAIRRSGRFDLEIEIPVPSSDMRAKLLQKMLAQYSITNPDIDEIAKHSHGFVAADLENLISKSMKIEEDGNGKFVASLTFQSIMENLSNVKPSAMREVLVEKPNVKWSDIGGMSDLKLKLKQIVEWPINHPETFERLGIAPPRGLLMFGPPGCSKTTIAKALATESNLNFISIKGSDLFSMWVGESEKAVRDLFVKARQISPCIVFFDEIDAIGSERSAESGSSVKERVLAQILTEIDGVNVLKNVIIVAATNRPDLIDKALMRPGRLDRIVYVQLPDVETRAEIFRIKLRKIPLGEDVNIDELAVKSEAYSGAEIEAICKEAALKALEDSFDAQQISMKYFDQSFELVKPRTSSELLQLYSDYENRK